MANLGYWKEAGESETAGKIWVEELERVARKHIPERELLGYQLAKAFGAVLRNSEWAREVREGFNARRSEWSNT